MKNLLAKPAHEVVYQELCKLISKHAHEISSIEVLAIAANMVGKLIAMQDQRTANIKIIMEMVVKNVEQGNKQVLDQINNTKGSA